MTRPDPFAGLPPVLQAAVAHYQALAARCDALEAEVAALRAERVAAGQRHRAPVAPVVPLVLSLADACALAGVSRVRGLALCQSGTWVGAWQEAPRQPWHVPRRGVEDWVAEMTAQYG